MQKAEILKQLVNERENIRKELNNAEAIYKRFNTTSNKIKLLQLEIKFTEFLLKNNLSAIKDEYYL